MDQGPSRWVALPLDRRAALALILAPFACGGLEPFRYYVAGLDGAAVELDFFDVSVANLAWSATGPFANGTLDLTDTRSGERVTYRKR